MSALLVGLAKKTQVGNSTAKLLLIIMCDYANDQGLAWPAVDTLAQEVEKGERTIQSARKYLVDKGFIRVAADQSATSHFRGDNRPTVYEITLDGVQQIAPRKPRKARAQKSAPLESTPNEVQATAPRTVTGCSQLRSRGAASCAHGVQPTAPKPSLEPSYPSSEGNHARETNTNNQLDTWTPNNETIALAETLNADLKAETAKYVDHLRATGNQPADLDAGLRLWLRRGAEHGYNQPAKAPREIRSDGARVQPERYQAPEHKHSAYCEHVKNLLKPIEQLFDHERRARWEPSQWEIACELAASRLNIGASPQQVFECAQNDKESISV